jgi:hypothetical protein
MYTEIFEIEFQAPGEVERYITFELWVKGMWTMEEIGGGDMRECLVIEEREFEDGKFSTDDQVLIQNWINANDKAIFEMFKERIKKYED